MCKKLCISIALLKKKIIVLTQLGPFLQQSHHHRRVPAANGPVQRPHPTVVHMLYHRSSLHQILDLHDELKNSQSRAELNTQRYVFNNGTGTLSVNAE